MVVCGFSISVNGKAETESNMHHVCTLETKYMDLSWGHILEHKRPYKCYNDHGWF